MTSLFIIYFSNKYLFTIPTENNSKSGVLLPFTKLLFVDHFWDYGVYNLGRMLLFCFSKESNVCEYAFMKGGTLVVIAVFVRSIL